MNTTIKAIPMPIIINYPEIVTQYNRRKGTAYTEPGILKMAYEKGGNLARGAAFIGVCEKTFSKALHHYRVPIRPHYGGRKRDFHGKTIVEKLAELSNDQLRTMTPMQIMAAIGSRSKVHTYNLLRQHNRPWKPPAKPMRPTGPGPKEQAILSIPKEETATMKIGAISVAPASPKPTPTCSCRATISPTSAATQKPVKDMQTDITTSLITCERYSCRLLPSACLARQEHARKIEKRLGNIDINLSFEPCLDCHQGKTIAKQKKERTPMEQTPVNTNPLCKECGTEPAAMNPHTGKPKNGLCGPCNGKRIKAGFAEKRAKEERKKEDMEYQIKNEAEKKLEEAVGRLKVKAEQRLSSLRASKTSDSTEPPEHMLLDFTRNKNLLAALSESAAADLRPVSMQALWIIREHFNQTEAQ